MGLALARAMSAEVSWPFLAGATKCHMRFHHCPFPFATDHPALDGDRYTSLGDDSSCAEPLVFQEDIPSVQLEPGDS